MSGVVHFEIPIKDFESAIKFYSDVFGWKISSWGEGEDYYLVDAGEGGVGGALFKAHRGHKTTVNTIAVDDIDAAIARVLASGGKIKGKKDMIPGIGWFVYGADLEGNRFGLLQPVMEESTDQ